MMLTIDVGNTKTSIGFFQNGTFVKQWKFATIANRMKDEYITHIRSCLESIGVEFSENFPTVLSCVVPSVATQLLGVSKNVHLVSHRSPIDFTIDIPSPEILGADIIADSQAAVVHYQSPSIVIDMGTASTLSFVDENKVFHGGVICPGLGVSAQALYRSAAALHEIPLTAKSRILGNNTKRAIQTGLCHGHASMMEGLCQKILTETKSKAMVIVTGGALEALDPLLPASWTRDPDLNLKGLASIGAKAL